MDNKEKLFSEIDDLITANTREGVIANYKADSEIIEESTLGRAGLVYNGFRYSYNKDTGDIVAKNICRAKLTILNNRNRPEVVADFSESVSSVRIRKHELLLSLRKNMIFRKLYSEQF